MFSHYSSNLCPEKLARAKTCQDICMCHRFKACFSVHILWHKWSHCLCWGVGQITLAVGLCTFALAQQMPGKEWNMGRGAAPGGFVQIFVFLCLSMCFLIGPPSTNLALRLVLSLFGAAAGAFLQGHCHLDGRWADDFVPLFERTCAHSRRSFPWPSCQWLLRCCRHLSPKYRISTHILQYIIWNAKHKPWKLKCPILAFSDQTWPGSTANVYICDVATEDCRPEPGNPNWTNCWDWFAECPYVTC